MDYITSNSGLQHISEEIFLNLDGPTILICQEVNHAWNQILDNSKFWLKMCTKNGLSKHNRLEWVQLIEAAKDDTCIDNEIKIHLKKMYLDVCNVDRSPIFEAIIWNFSEWIRILAPLLDNPNHPFQNHSNVLTGESFAGWTPIQLAVYPYCVSHLNIPEIIQILAPLSEKPNAADPEGWTPISRAVKNIQTLAPNPNAFPKKHIEENVKIIQILAPLSENPNIADPEGWTPINQAAKVGNSEIIEILAPLSENPNAADPEGWKPISWAAKAGNFKIIQILAPLSENPNAPDPKGWTPIHRGAIIGNKDIIELLAPWSNNPNAPDPRGYTPIARAAFRGDKEIIEILAPLSHDDVNSPDPKGWPPIARAAFNGNKEIVEILAPLTDNPNAPNNFGITPIQLAARNQITGAEIIKILAPLVNK